MAFLTIIAPMIALTYPLDKIKDGKAQAFSYWLREYIFNCLIQPVHLLLYAILITNAIDFASDNVLYAIVALAFMVPAEKFIKEMFGMKSSSPTGTLGAAAGGALVMSMLNKIKSKPPKEGAEAAGAGAASSPSGTRTARQAYGTNSQIPQPQGALQPQIQNQAQAQTTPQMANQGDPEVTGGQVIKPNDHLKMPQASQHKKPSIARGLDAIGEKYIYGVDTWKTRGKKFARGIGGAAVGALAGTTALAAQVADGDLFDNPEKALQETAVTAGIGYIAGSNFTGNRIQGVKNGIETFKKGAYGLEDYNNAKYNAQFFNSDAYKIIEQDPEIVNAWWGDKEIIKQVTNSYLNQGITDDKIIKDGMKAGVNGNEYKAASSLGVTDVKDYARVRDKNANKQLNAAQIAARMQIAKNMPEKLYNDKNGFVRYAKRYGIENEEDARRLFSEIDDFV